MGYHVIRCLLLHADLVLRITILFVSTHLHLIWWDAAAHRWQSWRHGKRSGGRGVLSGKSRQSQKPRRLSLARVRATRQARSEVQSSLPAIAQRRSRSSVL